VVGDGVGWSFQTGNVADLERHLSDLANHPERSLALRERARNNYETRYSPAVDLVRLEDIYREVSRS
jgi:glycosyltransferase involved in cell wall biosynthesis